ncbi:MAG: FAD-dependent oxidoreductase [Thermoanaerobaculales bacterium]|nr:FAD-dependent oxidoreductase [Thermoanaerobaculales bacterium]
MNIAVIGSGVSGLASAWLLSRKHEVHLFEKRARLGGHTHTVVHDVDGRELPLDTGFIVYNNATYPLLTRLFDELSVETRASDMSFSVSCANPDIEYASHSLRGLFADPSLLLSAAHLKMLVDVVRFGRRGRQILAGGGDPGATIAQFLSEGRFSQTFARYYLMPMVSAIWSSGTELAADYPRDALLRFLDNHGLLQVTGQPEWRTVVGGGRSYIGPLTGPLSDRIHLGHGVEKVIRGANDVEVVLDDGSMHSFDHVVIAAHADQALAMLAEPAAEEAELLGRWRYSVNDTWLHTDTALMPRRGAAWASWNYLMTDASRESASLTYHLNRLQGLDEDREYLVSLNPETEPVPESVIRRMSYSHPIFTHESVETQSELPRINGRNRTHFCGAYFGNGFHEDGLASAVAVADDLGVAF